MCYCYGARHFAVYRWSRGVIREVQFETADEYWSRNVKKGIIGLLQVNLGGQQRDSRYSSSFDYVRRRLRVRNRFRSPFARRRSSDANINSPYLVMEVSRFVSLSGSSLRLTTDLVLFYFQRLIPSVSMMKIVTPTHDWPRL